MLSLRQIPAALAALAVIAIAMPAPAATPEPAVSEAFMVPLFPQKERDLKKGLPSGMTAASFWAGRGVAKLTKLPDGKVLTEFDFEGLIPYGVYTLWSVVETEPFKDEPYTEFGAGKHAVSWLGVPLTSRTSGYAGVLRPSAGGPATGYLGT